ncbi:isoleucine--tRNA ligase [Saccharopolyspora rosea]|uniref:isoleucine--tRNA ligase n=1 Tax=Saccharopolyspora rosea TaxID=524884 RepID=UPI0021DA505A|nr:isoleucine--tRNA ligase [Saccharopolyspora rosea]
MEGRLAFRPLPPSIDLPDMERRTIDWWRERRVFERSLEQTAGGPRWVCYEGPPTANGTPGTHHVEARVFKDVLPRFKTMKGCSVPRRAGWDCHGLPVELAVEQELGINGKPDIERIGIAAFNARCRESVQRHVGEFEAVTERMGYWVDLSAAYWTMSPEYVDSVWWALRRIFRTGLLVEDFRVAPYCPRCGTTLSDHEVAQGYENVQDPSAYVRFPVRGALAGHRDVDLLVWTTTPWTLVSNTAVAAHPEVRYQVVRTVQGTFVVAKPLVSTVLGEDVEVLAELSGRELEGVPYEPPFELVDVPDAHRVVLADYVSTTDGTGLVHQAPAFGVDDLAVCRENGLPVVNPVDGDGRFAADVPLVGGLFFKDADPVLADDLRHRGLLLRYTTFEHPYPHCWRCHTPLMYYAQLSWYIRTTAIRDALHRENERTTWYPDHVKHGRYGDWLDNNVDWALSRSRYWGTPLPLWRCSGGHTTAVGSRAELGDLAGRDLSALDPHRPHVDEIRFPCPECGDPTTRVPEVVDAWFDSGSMPFAQLGFPHAAGSVAAFANNYPARFICEAIDQTRGWFYTLMAVGTLLFDRSAYDDVLCLGHIVAEDGRKMSKHLGNVLEPLPLMDEHGADALRWFMLCSGSPWSARRVGHGPLREIVRGVLMTYWNTASFFTRYASLSDWVPADADPPAHRHFLDRWVLAELHRLVQRVDAGLEDYDTAGCGRALATFVDDLSNWYVRRSRRRFWDGEVNALATLHTCLDVLTRLLAPFIPFLTEQVWQDVVRPGAPDAAESVHLARWPRAETALVDTALLSRVDVVRRLAEAGRAARRDGGVKVRQPLGRALFGIPSGIALPAELLDDLADELNVRRLEPLSAAGEVLDVSVRPDFRSLGRRFGRCTQEVAAAITAADPDRLAERLRATGRALVEVDGERVPITTDDVHVSEVPRSGWVVESQHDVTIALDTGITPELRRAGLAREVVRFLQDCRRRDGLHVADRIAVRWRASGEVRDAVLEHADDIARAVLATEFAETADASAEHHAPELGFTAQLRKIG